MKGTTNTRIASLINSGNVAPTVQLQLPIKSGQFSYFNCTHMAQVPTIPTRTLNAKYKRVTKMLVIIFPLVGLKNNFILIERIAHLDI